MKLFKHLPRLTLAVYPTPLIAVTQLAQQLNINALYFKRDDLISFGLGGNKIRALEFIIADALAKKANAVVTGAGIQSNHVRATAAVAAYYGMACHAVYWGNLPETVEGNYRLTKMLGATIHFTNDTERGSVDTAIIDIAQALPNSYAIPRGGACALGVLGHVLAVEELYQQCQKLNITIDTIVLAGGSGGTCAGWLLGIQLLNLPWQVHCFSVSRPAQELHSHIARLVSEAAELLQVHHQLQGDKIRVNDEFIGAGYGIPSVEAATAINLVGRTEGVLLDPTYTGKAMAGYLKHCTQNQRTVFIHSGGEPAFFVGNGQWLNYA